MAKRGKLSDFKATEPAPTTVRPSSTPGVPAVSDKVRTKSVTIRLNVDAWRMLKLLALDDERTAHALMIEAFNDYLEKRGKGRLA